MKTMLMSEDGWRLVRFSGTKYVKLTMTQIARQCQFVINDSKNTAFDKSSFYAENHSSDHLLPDSVILGNITDLSHKGNGVI